MKPLFRMLVFAWLVTGALMIVTAQRRAATPAVKINGVYENISVGKESGDLEGMRLVIVDGSGDYYALVQIAGGGAELPVPVLVKLTISGANIAFALPQQDGGDAQKFKGTVTATGLRLRSSPGDAAMLKRKPCASL
jgi:hypothetical protein